MMDRDAWRRAIDGEDAPQPDLLALFLSTDQVLGSSFVSELEERVDRASRNPERALDATLVALRSLPIRDAELYVRGWLGSETVGEFRPNGAGQWHGWIIDPALAELTGTYSAFYKTVRILQDRIPKP
jgi:hypothetical protein